MGIDPGWGSSAFGIVLLQVSNGRIEVLVADEFERPRYEDMASKVIDMIRGLNRRETSARNISIVVRSMLTLLIQSL